MTWLDDYGQLEQWEPDPFHEAAAERDAEWQEAEREQRVDDWYRNEVNER